LTAGLRLEHTRYDYNNQSGDGDACEAGVANCRFYRPADRVDEFTTWSPKLGLLQQVTDNQQLYVNLRQSHRAPQATELYRLQNGQQFADLNSEQLTAAELGYRGDFARSQVTVSVFDMQKKHYIFQDTDRQNISDGESSHQGAELTLLQQLMPQLELQLSASYARHRYDDDTAISQVSIAGNDIDTAPRRLARASLAWHYSPGATASLEAISMGRYYLNPENTQRYPGHTLLNVRVTHSLDNHWQLGVRVTNLENIDYAERADFAFGAERYFVGEPRSVYVSVQRAFSG